MSLTQELTAMFAKRLGLPADSVRAETALTDLVPSSFTLVELLIELQESYGFRVTQDELRELRTVADVIALVERKRG